MGYERNEEGSRRDILTRLSLRGTRWTCAIGILGELGTSGPWSEDLQALVREGLVECQDTVNEMHNRSFVRLAQ